MLNSCQHPKRRLMNGLDSHSGNIDFIVYTMPVRGNDVNGKAVCSANDSVINPAH